MLNPKLVRDYLDWSDKGTERLLKSAVLKRTEKVCAVLEAPAFSDPQQSERFVEAALKANFHATNLSLLKFSKNLYKPPQLELINTHLKPLSAHGSSIKREIKTGISFCKFLAEDLKILKKLNPKRNLTVNFDLYAGHLKNLFLKPSFNKTQTENINQICQILKLKGNESPSFLLLQKIIQDIALIFKNSGFQITLEIPGSKGWSMFPEINPESLQDIMNLIEKYIPKAGLCIDVGHVLTWSRKPKELNEYLYTLKKFGQQIKMLHISSAGSWPSSFVRLYRTTYGKQNPLWHIKSLDVALPICEKQQLSIISQLREMANKKELLEVSEVRTPTDAIEDYFPGFDLNFIKNSPYFTNIIKQAQILGYAKKTY